MNPARDAPREIPRRGGFRGFRGLNPGNAVPLRSVRPPFGGSPRLLPTVGVRGLNRRVAGMTVLPGAAERTEVPVKYASTRTRPRQARETREGR